MPTNKIANVDSAASIHDGYHTGIGTERGSTDNGRLFVNRGASTGREPIPTNQVIDATTSFTLTPAQDGAIVVADSTTSVIVTLPATSKGLRYTLVVGQLTTSVGHSFSPASVDKIMGNGFTAADDKDAQISAATDRIGDTITVVGDGVDGWYITSVIGTVAREA